MIKTATRYHFAVGTRQLRRQPSFLDHVLVLSDAVGGRGIIVRSRNDRFRVRVRVRSVSGLRLGLGLGLACGGCHLDTPTPTPTPTPNPNPEGGNSKGERGCLAHSRGVDSGRGRTQALTLRLRLRLKPKSSRHAPLMVSCPPCKARSTVRSPRLDLTHSLRLTISHSVRLSISCMPLMRPW